MSDGSIAVVETPVTLGYGSNNIGTQNVITSPSNSPVTVYSDPSSNPPTYGTTGPVQPVGFNTVSFGSSNTIVLAAPPITAVINNNNYDVNAGRELGFQGDQTFNSKVLSNSLPPGNTIFPADQRQSNSMMGTASTPNYPNYTTPPQAESSDVTGIRSREGGPAAYTLNENGQLVSNPAYQEYQTPSIAGMPITYQSPDKSLTIVNPGEPAAQLDAPTSSSGVISTASIDGSGEAAPITASVPQSNPYGFGDNVSQTGTPSVGGFGISGVTGTTPEGTTTVAQPTTSFSPSAGGDSVSGSSPAGGAASAASPGGAAGGC
jgi:hypothetical protein